MEFSAKECDASSLDMAFFGLDNLGSKWTQLIRLESSWHKIYS